MADLDDLREGTDYSGATTTENGFHLKGQSGQDWGLRARLSRVFDPADGKTVMLAFDHGYFQGPTSGLERLDRSILPLVPQADALMCTRGALRTTNSLRTRRVARAGASRAMKRRAAHRKASPASLPATGARRPQSCAAEDVPAAVPFRAPRSRTPPPRG